MRNIKARLLSPSASLQLAGGIGLMLLAGLAACSHPETSTGAPEPQARTEDRRLTVDPYADKTPAQRRAEWLKRQSNVQPASATTDIARKPEVRSN